MSIAIAVVAGVLVGVVMGALGGGGAIITVPVLVYALGKEPYAATTASLVIVGLSSIVALIPHARRKRVRWSHGVVFGVIGIPGTAAGSALSARLDPRWLMVGFAVLLVAVATVMLIQARRRLVAGQPVAGRSAAERSAAAGQAVGGEPAVEEAAAGRQRAEQRERAEGLQRAGRRQGDRRTGLRGIASVVGAAAGVGLLTGFFGVGGGFAIVPALVLMLGFSMPTAVGTSLFVVALNCASAFGARLGGDVALDWPVVITFTAAAMASSLLGGRLSARARPTTLQQAFASLLYLVAAYTGINSIIQLG